MSYWFYVIEEYSLLSSDTQGVFFVVTSGLFLYFVERWEQPNVCIKSAFLKRLLVFVIV